ncbi:hypothetical protein GO495_09260 [Chitinophaga oryziterrae]|uniref:Uncharacterized protein n=1 Tax=Chitinophaga oryziterrae TaxID=1031224 RepID=A0A6N8J669_9BACT|nr:hypothetical protein [Chitinophaga oryziterrae]MVT40765.1 hypothetical protein [Chitinophaga oryziterrae]
MSTSSLIYSADPGLLIGFHGCDHSVRNSVVAGRKMLKASQNRHDWLGAGFYFWQNNYDRALDFATNPPGKTKIIKPAVLGAIFSLGNCLDLTDKKWIDLVKLSYDSLKQSAESEGNKLPVNKNAKDSKDKVLRELDCAVIENIHKVVKELGDPPFDSVRGIFIEGASLYDGAGFHEKTHVQICIRNPNCIKGFFLPRKDVNWP